MRIKSKLVYQCPLFKVAEEDAVEPGGHPIRRSIVHHSGSAVMMAVDERGRVLLVRQYRLAVRASLWELPAGRLDPGETALAAARRELEEETGYRARRWKKLLSFYPSPGYVSEKMTLFQATGLTAGDPTPMEDESIEARWFTPAQLARLKLEDGKTLLGLSLLR
jgi:ADP-ribose pyrophosphatase